MITSFFPLRSLVVGAGIALFMSTSAWAQVTDDTVVELLGRVEQLESQLRAQTGRLEELDFKARRLEEQLKKQQQDVEFRFQELQQKPATAVPAKPATNSSAPVPATPSPASAPSASVSAPPSADPSQQFDLAYSSYQKGDFDQAIDGFQSLIKGQPQHRLVPVATFWLGESFAKKRMNKEAAQQFLQVIQRFPQSLRAPDAMVRLGGVLGDLGEKEAACSTLGGFSAKYPKASDPLKTRAQNDMKRLRCG